MGKLPGLIRTFKPDVWAGNTGRFLGEHDYCRLFTRLADRASFGGGTLWLTVRVLSSNTKVSFFQAYATGVQPFRAVISSTRMPNAFTTVAKLDQDQTCLLQHGADMVQALTEGIVKLDRVIQCKGYVVAANLAEKVSLRSRIWSPKGGQHEREIG